MKSLKDIFEDYIQYPIRFMYQRIYNLIRWFPIIWKDRDWDDWYVFTILETKLKHQAEYIGTKDRHTRAKRDAEIMMTCVRLIQKIKEEKYDGEYMDYHESSYNWLDIPDKSDYKQLDIELKSERFDEYFLEYPLDYKRVITNTANQIFSIDGDIHDVEVKQRIAMNMGMVRQRRAHKLLFKLLERNILMWWD
jgi:hypothetical protein